MFSITVMGSKHRFSTLFNIQILIKLINNTESFYRFVLGYHRLIIFKLLIFNYGITKEQRDQ